VEYEDFAIITDWYNCSSLRFFTTAHCWLIRIFHTRAGKILSRFARAWNRGPAAACVYVHQEGEFFLIKLSVETTTGNNWSTYPVRKGKRGFFNGSWARWTESRVTLNSIKDPTLER